MSVRIDTTNTTDPCKNNSCCANVTLNIILVRYNKYFIKLTSNSCRHHQMQILSIQISTTTYLYTIPILGYHMK